MSIATSIFLIAVGAILRYAIEVTSDVVNIQDVGLILMICGGAGLAISLLYEAMHANDGRPPRDDIGPDDRTRRLR